jgi:magnesium transporter
MPGYPPDTAGGIMSTDFLTVPWTATVEDALQRIRGHRGGVHESVCATYVVDAEDRLRRVVSLRELVSSDSARRIWGLGKKKLCIVLAGGALHRGNAHRHRHGPLRR